MEKNTRFGIKTIKTSPSSSSLSYILCFLFGEMNSTSPSFRGQIKWCFVLSTSVRKWCWYGKAWTSQIPLLGNDRNYITISYPFFEVMQTSDLTLSPDIGVTGSTFPKGSGFQPSQSTRIAWLVSHQRVRLSSFSLGPGSTAGSGAAEPIRGELNGDGRKWPMQITGCVTHHKGDL